MQDVKIEKCSGINSFRIVMKKVYKFSIELSTEFYVATIFTI